MHPALSVIFFTSLSGAGYGLWVWMAVAMCCEAAGRPPALGHAVGLLLGAALVTIGLISSLAHLGQPQRAWRALSQWRSSWLSREGVLALLTYLPAALLLALWAFAVGAPAWVSCLLLLALAAGSLGTVACTAMIYASLKPIPAWRHRLVVPLYLGFALFTGGLFAAVLHAFLLGSVWKLTGPLLLLVGLLLVALKQRYWGAIDQVQPVGSAASAVGLTPGHRVRAWEAPHTEANYLTREMGFVLARRHRTRLRAIAVLLIGVLPAMPLLAVGFLPQPAQGPLFALAALLALAGTLVERWLFFAEARHMVTLYYG